MAERSRGTRAPAGAQQDRAGGARDMGMPPADIEVTGALVHALLVEQHPDLAALPLEPAGAGWDNVLFRLGDDLVVRLPRHAAGARLLANEQTWLPRLAGRLPLSVPVPVRRGVPSDAFPWVWSVCPWYHGTPGDAVEALDAEATARDLGAFFRALHRTAPADAPVNPFRSPAAQVDRASFEARCEAVSAMVDVSAVRHVWEEGRNARVFVGPRSWIHGDPHPANMLFADGRPTAVVDFGDVCAGDPATDLSCMWMLLPGRAHSSFVEAYGGIDADLAARARAWAALFGVILLGLGRTDRPSYEAVGRATLARLTATGD